MRWKVLWVNFTKGYNITWNRKVLKVADYKTRKIKYADGSVEDITLPQSDVVYLGLSNEQFVCIRPMVQSQIKNIGASIWQW